VPWRSVSALASTSLLEQAEVDATVEERHVDSEHAARRERFLGSPTLRIEGHDVDPGAASRHDYGLRCRLYPTENGLERIPPDAWITRALQAACSLSVGLPDTPQPGRSRP
jgi:hypothetical protein